MKTYFHACCMAVLFLTVISCSEIRKENIVETGTVIHHDDVEYYVTDYKKSRVLKIKNDTLLTDGFFYIVTFKVINNALRVDHDWGNQTAYIIDEDGNRYENKTDLQKKLNEVKPFGFKETYATPFQSEETTRFVFELPSSAEKPYLKVRGEILMEDFLDGSTFEKTKVKLF